MEFSVHLLDSVVACDNALLKANKTKADFEFKLMALTRQHNHAVESTSANQLVWTKAQADRSIIVRRLEALLPGQSDFTLVKRRMQLDLKIHALRMRIAARGKSSVIKLEYTITCVEKALELNASLIATIAQRKSDLSSQAA